MVNTPEVNGFRFGSETNGRGSVLVGGKTFSCRHNALQSVTINGLHMYTRAFRTMKLSSHPPGPMFEF